MKTGKRKLTFLMASIVIISVVASSITFVNAGISGAEDEYLVGDWNGDKKSDLAVRRGASILMSTNLDRVHDIEQAYGGGNAEDEYLVGDWDGDGRDNLAVRRGATILMDINYDGTHDIEQAYGSGNAEDEYLVGDWDGDGRDNVAVRRDATILMDINYDGIHDIAQAYGAGNAEDEYLVGDWDGDGRDNLAVRRGSTILMDINYDCTHDIEQAYGSGDAEEEYFSGDWDGNRRDNIAVRRGPSILMDVNYDCIHDIEQVYGIGSEAIHQEMQTALIQYSRVYATAETLACSDYIVGPQKVKENFNIVDSMYPAVKNRPAAVRVKNHYIDAYTKSKEAKEVAIQRDIERLNRVKNIFNDVAPAAFDIACKEGVKAAIPAAGCAIVSGGSAAAFCVIMESELGPILGVTTDKLLDPVANFVCEPVTKAIDSYLNKPEATKRQDMPGKSVEDGKDSRPGRDTPGERWDGNDRGRGDDGTRIA